MERSGRVAVVDGLTREEPLESVLADAGFEVLSASGVGDLEAVLRETTVDCVVSTYQVPRPDGLEFLGGLHALETVADHDPEIPRILYTDIVNPDLAREAVSLGLFDYVPANTAASQQRLVTRVREATEHRRAERRVDELSRVSEVIREVLTVVIRAESHAAVFEEVTDTLVATEAYTGAWFGRATDTGLDCRAVAGSVPQSAVPELLASADGLTVTAPDTPSGQRSVVVPVGNLSLVLFTDRPEAFAETERSVLSQLGATIEYSLDAITTHETLQRREAALEDKTERLSTFASVVGHDLRNPLSVASGNLELAKAGDRDRLEAVESALDRMGDIIDDVLSLARDGERSIDVEAVSLPEAVAAAWTAVETADATLEAPDDGTVLADPSQHRRLLENLVRNAVEHGPPSVTVTVERTETGFAVADDGPGLTPGDRETAFEFGVTTSDAGTGLGLAIVAEIASAHGWSVSVGESAAGGARFEISGVEFAD